MNIGLPAMKVQSDYEVEDEEEEKVHVPDDHADIKLLLFPSQIHKLTSLLALLAHMRDLIHRLSKIAVIQAPATSFDWKCQMMYSYKQETKTVPIKVSYIPHTFKTGS